MMPVIQPLNLPKKTKTHAQLEQEHYLALVEQATRARRRACARASFSYLSTLFERH